MIGYAVIIINENPVDSAYFPVREAAGQDELNIQNAFCTNLGFEWLNQGQHKDLRKSNVFHDDPCVNTATCACLSCKIQATDHTQSECFLLIISSHGGEDNKKQVVAFSDGQNVSVPELIDMLSDKKCPSLQGKPRILILQACRSNPDLPEGERNDHGVHVHVSNATPPERKMESMEEVITSGEESDADVVDDDHVYFEGSGIPEQFIIVYPSVSGKRAMRNNTTGSWLIMELCKEICKHMEAPQYRMNPEMNFMKILTRTTGEVAKKKTKVHMRDSKGKSTSQLDEKRSGLKNAVCTIHRLTKPLVFRPLIKPIDIPDVKWPFE